MYMYMYMYMKTSNKIFLLLSMLTVTIIILYNSFTYNQIDGKNNYTSSSARGGGSDQEERGLSKLTDYTIVADKLELLDYIITYLNYYSSSSPILEPLNKLKIVDTINLLTQKRTISTDLAILYNLYNLNSDINDIHNHSKVEIFLEKAKVITGYRKYFLNIAPNALKDYQYTMKQKNQIEFEEAYNIHLEQSCKPKKHKNIGKYQDFTSLYDSKLDCNNDSNCVGFTVKKTKDKKKKYILKKKITATKSNKKYDCYIKK